MPPLKDFKDLKSTPMPGRTEYAIRCRKHGQVVYFIVYDHEPIFALNRDDFFIETVTEALKNCSGCITEQEYAKSRFPEGAEI